MNGLRKAKNSCTNHTLPGAAFEEDRGAGGAAPSPPRAGGSPCTSGGWKEPGVSTGTLCCDHKPAAVPLESPEPLPHAQVPWTKIISQRIFLPGQ